MSTTTTPKTPKTPNLPITSPSNSSNTVPIPHPVRVPKSTSTYTQTTRASDLRSEINTLLLRDGHVEKIQSSLHHALHADPSNWPSRIRAHALELLREGEVTTFPMLMERVLEDVRRDSEKARLARGEALGGVNGTAAQNGQAQMQQAGVDQNSLAVPQAVVEEGVRVTRECLELVCEMEE